MNTKLSFKLDVFEGPLDLLLHLIDKNKINIYDIPIASITEQYFEYLELMEQMDLDISSDFVLVAANLIYIKSKMLLPKHKDNNEDEENDPRSELVEKLLEYKKYKELSKYLKNKENSDSNIYFKKFIDVKDYKMLYNNKNMSMDMLINALLGIISRKDENKDEVVQEKVFDTIVRKNRISIRSRIKKILYLLKNKKKMNFYSIFENMRSRPEIVANFLAILELTRLNRIFFVHKKNKVYIHLKKR